MAHRHVPGRSCSCQPRAAHGSHSRQPGSAGRADAIPVTLDVAEVPYRDNGDYQFVIHLVSPTDSAGLRDAMSLTEIYVTESDNVSWGRQPLPTELMDLAPLLEAAYADGMTGTLRQASLMVWESGPAWQLLPRRPQGRTYSALTGEPIQGDATGYVADYNEHREQAVAGIQALVATLTPSVNPLLE